MRRNFACFFKPNSLLLAHSKFLNVESLLKGATGLVN
jgi:hypothetical protein